MDYIKVLTKDWIRLEKKETDISDAPIRKVLIRTDKIYRVCLSHVVSSWYVWIYIEDISTTMEYEFRDKSEAEQLFEELQRVIEGIDIASKP